MSSDLDGLYKSLRPNTFYRHSIDLEVELPAIKYVLGKGLKALRKPDPFHLLIHSTATLRTLALQEQGHKGTSKNGPVIDLLSMAPDVSWVRRGLVSAISGFLPPDAQVGA